MTAAQWLSSWARIKPDLPAVVFEDQVITWGELDERASRVANVLIGRDVVPGDRVACLLRNRAEFLEVFVGTLRAGGVFVPLNALATAPELVALVQDCGADVIVTDSGYCDIARAMVDAGTVATFLSVDTALPVAHSLLGEAMAKASPADPGVARSSSDTACIYYTSGSTGRPKGAVVSHDNIHYATLNWLLDLGFSQQDRFLLTMPLCFTGAMSVVAPALHGGITLHVERSFDAGRALEIIERDRITFMVGVPTMATAMMRDPDFATRDLTSLRMVMCGAAPIPMTIFEAFTDRGVPFVGAFGMTELTGGFSMVTPVEQAAQRLGTAGRPSLYTETRLILDDGTDAPDGEIGELLLRGPLVFQGYWNNPTETAATIVDGWLHSGDLARRDEDGYFWIVDRKKGMIISGGLNVYPAEVENALLRLGDVVECAVFGVPDEKWGERVTASLVLTPGSPQTEETIRSHCRTLVATYKVPRQIDFHEHLPRTTSGKIRRRTLRDEARAIAAS